MVLHITLQEHNLCKKLPNFLQKINTLYHMSTSGTWNSWWAFHWIQLKAATVQHHGQRLGNIAQGSRAVASSRVGDRRMRWVMRRQGSAAYPIHSGMSRVFYLPQNRTLSTRHPLALRRMRSTGSSWQGFEPGSCRANGFKSQLL